MDYRDSPQMAPRPAGLPFGMLMLFIVGAVVLFMVFRNARRAAEAEAERRPAASPSRTDSDRVGDVPRNGSQPSTTRKGDWAIEEVETSPAAKTAGDASRQNASTPPASKSTKKGDWAIEEVDPSKAPEGPKLTKEDADPSAKPQTKSTKKGDWAIEEVDGANEGSADKGSADKDSADKAAKSPTSNGAGTAKTETRKKTKSGDWELEEVKTK